MDKTKLIFKEDSFKILQLTDIHVGGCLFTRKEDKLALDGVRSIVNEANPDFIAVTGDAVYPMVFYPKPFVSGTINNLKSIKMFAEVM